MSVDTGHSDTLDRSYVLLAEDKNFIEEDCETYANKLRKHKTLRRHTDAKMAAWAAMRRSYRPFVPDTWDEYVTTVRQAQTMFASYLECREARLAEAEAWLAIQQHLASKRLTKDGGMRERPMKRLLKAKDEVDRLRGRVERGRERLDRFEGVVADSMQRRGVIDDALREELRRLVHLIEGTADDHRVRG